ncbi:efflux RND transporter periplasmic adaptor subunit [Aliidiomarina sp. Khilg15.8]
MVRRLFLLVTALLLCSGAAANDRILVQTHSVEMTSIVELTTIDGSTASLRDAALSAQLAGMVVSVHAEPGDKVAQGALLVQLDDALSKSERQAARAQRDETMAELEDAKLQVTELRRLREDNNVAESELRRAEARAEALDARRQRFAAELAAAETRYQQHQVRAPFAGTIRQRMATPGEWVTPGNALYELIDTDNLYADFALPQRYLNALRIGDLVQITLPAEFSSQQPRPMAAQIERIVAAQNATTRTFVVRVRFDGDRMLTSGMGLRATFSVPTGRRNPVVPRDAVQRYADGRTSVWEAVENESGELVARERMLDLGVAMGADFEVRDGIDAGARVVIRGNESLREGVRLREESR